MVSQDIAGKLTAPGQRVRDTFVRGQEIIVYSENRVTHTSTARCAVVLEAAKEGLLDPAAVLCYWRVR